MSYPQYTLDTDAKKRERRDVFLKKVVKNRCTNGLANQLPW